MLHDEIAGLLAEDFDLSLLGITEELYALLRDQGEGGAVEGEDDIPEGITSDRPMPIKLYCQLRHAAFRTIDKRLEIEDQFLANMGLSLKVALSVPSFTAVWRAVEATDLIGMIPRRLLERVVGPAGLEIHPIALRAALSAPLPSLESASLLGQRACMVAHTSL